MIESEIRNVKHLDNIEKLKEDGLTLCISIEKSPCGKEPMVVEINEENIDKHQRLFKIGVWLQHPQELSKSLLLKRIKPLAGEIYNKDTYAAKLGGTFQDKVCAAMLFNGSFVSVQNDFENKNASDRDKIYYPWIKVGSSIDDVKKADIESITDFELSYRKMYPKLVPGANEYFENEYPHDKGIGYLKKYIHLWRGDDVLEIDSESKRMIKAGWDNPSRFRFVYTKDGDVEGLNDMLELDIIQVKRIN